MVSSTVAESLLRLGLLMACVLFAQVVAHRHMSVETIPRVLRARVLMCDRLRPWLMVTALTMAAAGLLLSLQ